MDRRRSPLKAVIDTNVVAYLLLGTEKFAEEARECMTTVVDPWAPAVWEAELANTLWMAVRHKVLSLADATGRLTLADGLGIHTISNRHLWKGALTRAHTANVAVYDALFVELAVRERVPLATFDNGLLRAFPDVARRPGRIARR